MRKEVIFYLTLINQRLLRLKEVIKLKKTDYKAAIDSLKPPIFWKDKPNFISQVRLWNLKKLNYALEKLIVLK